MNEDKRRALEAAGFASGDAEDFLGLTDVERRLVDLRVTMSRAIRARRLEQGLTQAEVARRINTSQPRVAKIEAGSPDVSLDLMVKEMFALGIQLEDLQVIGRKRRDKASPRRAQDKAQSPRAEKSEARRRQN